MDLVTGLSLGRVGLGAVALARPTAVSALLALDSPGHPGSTVSPTESVVARLFGVREVALGVTTMLAPPALRPSLLTSGVLVDLGDAAACVLGRRSGALGARVAGPALAVGRGRCRGGRLRAQPALKSAGGAAPRR